MENELVLTKNDSSVTVNLQGAHVTSWKIHGAEQLFMSPTAKFDGKSEVFGGIPIIFPRLGSWGEGRPFHGFARTSRWELFEEDDGKKDGIATFQLKTDALSRSCWDAEFVLRLTIALREDQLNMDLRVENVGEASFEFTALFHNYLCVEDLRRVSLHGLTGSNYKDAADGWIDKIDGDSCLNPKGPLDRVYANTQLQHRIDCPSGRRVFVDKSESLTDTVIWTPWDSFSDGDFSLFLCVEPGNVINRQILGPNESFIASQTLRVEI